MGEIDDWHMTMYFILDGLVAAVCSFLLQFVYDQRLSCFVRTKSLYSGAVSRFSSIDY